MKAVKSLYLVIFLFAFSVTDSFAQNSEFEAHMENHKAKVQEFDWLIGKWEWKATWLSTGRESIYVQECRWILQKTAVQCDGYEPGGSPEMAEESTVYSYDSTLQNHVAMDLTAGSRTFFEKDHVFKNGENWVVQSEKINANKWFHQRVFTPKGDSIEGVLHRSTNGSEFKKLQEFTMTRMD